MTTISYVFLAIMVVASILYVSFWINAGKKKKLAEMKKNEEKKNNAS